MQSRRDFFGDLLREGAHLREITIFIIDEEIDNILSSMKNSGLVHAFARYGKSN